MAIICDGQKAYGKNVELQPLFAYFKLKLESRFSVDQVIYALNKYTDSKNDIPAPADIINILNPPKPRISEAQFVEAQKWQEKNGWPMFSDAQETIDLYRQQEKDARDSHKTEVQRIEQAGSGFKQIGQ